VYVCMPLTNGRVLSTEEEHALRELEDRIDGLEAEAAGPCGYFPPRHPTHFEPWSLASIGTL